MRYVRVLLTGVDETTTTPHTTKEYELRLGDNWLTTGPPEDTLSMLASYIQQVHKDLKEHTGGVN